MRSRRKLLIGLAIATGSLCIVAWVMLCVAVLLAPGAYNRLLAGSSLQVGETAPDFQLTTLSGETVTLSQFRGQPVLLTFGATWCPDCWRESPLLQELYERQTGLVILMVDSKEDAQTVQAYADEYGLTFPIALDRDGAVADAYRVWAIPTEHIIDADGVVRARIIERVTEESLAAMLEQAGITP